MRIHTAGWLRRKAGEDVARNRLEWLGLLRQNLRAEIEMHENHRIRTAVGAVYNEARRRAMAEAAAAEEVSRAHRPAARRAAGAAGHPERANGVFLVAKEMSAADLLRLATQACAEGDGAAQWAIAKVCAERAPDDRDLKPVFDVLNAVTTEEAQYAVDWILCREELVLLAIDEAQALSLRPVGISTAQLGALYDARSVTFDESDKLTLNDGEIRRGREMVNCPFVPVPFAMAPEPPKDR